MTRRLLLSHLSLILLVLLALEVPFGVFYARSELSRFSRTAEQGAMTLAEVCEEKMEHGLTADLPELADAYGQRTGGTVLVADRRGVVLTDSGSRRAHRPCGWRRSASSAWASGRSCWAR
ncbi:hypothetical protein AB0H10_38815, partial [Streptomyces longwoodensis]